MSSVIILKVVVTKSHIPALDGLRGAAALTVLAGHSAIGTYLPPNIAKFAVCVFFVLSGFLITRILLHEKRSGMPLRCFLARRAARIFPAYYLTIIAVGLIVGWEGSPWALTYTYNWSPSIDVVPDHIKHTWSLCVEEQFYILWPVVVAFASVSMSRAFAIRLLVASIVTIPLIETFGPVYMSPTATTTLIYRSTMSNAMPLLVGCLLAYNEAEWRRAVENNAVSMVFAAAVLIYLIAVPSSIIASSYHLTIRAVFTTIAATSLFFASNSKMARRVFEFRPLRVCGTISYGLYLYHFPIFQGVFGFTSTLFVIPATFAVSVISFRYFEQPLRMAGYAISNKMRSTVHVVAEPSSVTVD